MDMLAWETDALQWNKSVKQRERNQMLPNIYITNYGIYTHKNLME